MPLAVSNSVPRARQAALLFDVRRLNGARAYLDLAPRPDHSQQSERANSQHSDCTARSTDSNVMIQRTGYKAEMTLKPGSSLKLPCACGCGRLSREDVRISDGNWVTVAGQELIALNGAAPRVEIPIEEGRVTPLEMVIIPPEDADKGSRFWLDVTQMSDGAPTGGVSLFVEAQ